MTGSRIAARGPVQADTCDIRCLCLGIFEDDVRELICANNGCVGNPACIFAYGWVRALTTKQASARGRKVVEESAIRIGEQNNASPSNHTCSGLAAQRCSRIIGTKQSGSGILEVASHQLPLPIRVGTEICCQTPENDPTTVRGNQWRGRTIVRAGSA